MERTAGTFYVPLESLRIRKNVPAGINLYVLIPLAQFFRTTTQDAPPVLVVPDVDGFRITDGRHRFLAAIISGRSELLCVLDSHAIEHGHTGAK